ncbi:hypothetical protein [Streptomyces sp. H27-D2]|uniref:hypothetical protein n=1 Tax=Streptomyces sp. H27-D2 TaxID=3046304 RepID=UPI002DBF139A|nr:hypothetical protein [Streptomyces sp. H27-D2]MEC4020445.1 hypothetical protein [Streptomyces sp. H27-D2]
MARDFDDDAPRRIQDANELISARQRDADERIYVVTTNLVIDAQEQLARRRRLDRIWRAGWAVSWLSLLTAVIGTGIAALSAGDPARFVLGDLICGSLLLLSLLALVGAHFAGRDLPTLQRAEAQLASAQESLWKQKAKQHLDLDDRRKVYEEVTTAIEQYQADSRKYRRIHNGLQTLIMIGSASTVSRPRASPPGADSSTSYTPASKVPGRHGARGARISRLPRGRIRGWAVRVGGTGSCRFLGAFGASA